MIKRRHLRDLTIILILIIPLVSAGLHDSLPSFSVWVVNADSNDVSTNLAVQTLLQETADTGLNLRETTLARLGSVPLNVLILVGHGEPDGLETSGTLIPWPELYGAIADRQPEKTVVLACDSPSDPTSNVFGFEGTVDAEAGAIMIGWYLKQTTMPNIEIDFPFDRVARAQSAMRNPLGRYLYLVHGYWGDDGDFALMVQDFSRRDNFFKTDYDVNNVRFFDYYKAYGATTEAEKDQVHQTYSISDFAYNLYDELNDLPSGSQVNIIAHSMGGLITREMLRLYRTDLETAGIDFGKIITLGTPHSGTNLANPLLTWISVSGIISNLVMSAELWPSPVFYSMDPWSQFLGTFNADITSYSSGIDWYTISGYDAIPSAALLFVHLDTSDPIVARGRAHLSFAKNEYFDVGHNPLIEDGTTYDTVSNWITEGPDTDGDGLTDDAEIYYHGTNPNSWDSDGDGISDGNEILWGYDPLN